MSTVTINSSFTWIGNTPDWNDPNNWCGGSVPGPNDNLTIPELGSGLFYPVIDVTSGIGQAHDIMIAVGASLTVTGETLEIAGAVTNNGTFDASQGKIEFNGTTPQTIAANTFMS